MNKGRMTRRLRTVPFDAAEYLNDEATRLAYLNEVLAECDAGAVAAALGTIARARGMSEVAHRSGLGRESLYKALGEHGNPGFKTILGVAAALGYRFEMQPAIARRSRKPAER
jgi:probable addiction module antidote protein